MVNFRSESDIRCVGRGICLSDIRSLAAKKTFHEKVESQGDRKALNMYRKPIYVTKSLEICN